MVKLFGSQHYELAADAVQSALTSALETWKFRGIPNNPKAWLYRAAKNKAIDVLRHNKQNISLDLSIPEHQLLNSGFTLKPAMDDIFSESHIKNDFLAMMFACCRPEISPENQVAFVLKTLCGFSTQEIAKAFLTSEDTISKRIYRTKEFFRQENIRPKLPDPKDLPGRTSHILSCIYLIFNEGYNATATEDLIRKDVISQALELGQALCDYAPTRLPEVYALMALMCFHASRAESRVTVKGGLILLPEQDRTLWDSDLIRQGNEYLNKSAFGDRLSIYHIEAAIAFEHCTAKSFTETRWEKILGYYDMLVKITPSPVVYLNRCAALLELFGPPQALEGLEHIPGKKSLENYYLYHSLKGEIRSRMSQNLEALNSFQIAESLTRSPVEKSYLKNRIKALRDLI